jgi:hypothetical protein
LNISEDALRVSAKLSITITENSCKRVAVMCSLVARAALS